MKESNVLKMKQSVRAALDASQVLSVSDISQTVRKLQADLFNEWALEKLAALIRLEIREKEARSRPPDPYQMFFEGFRDLSERLPLKGGGSVPLASATITDLRKNLKTMRDKAEEKAQRTIRLIKGMERYSKVQRGLTVQRYCELRAAENGPRRLKRA